MEDLDARIARLRGMAPKSRSVKAADHRYITVRLGADEMAALDEAAAAAGVFPGVFAADLLRKGIA